MAGNLDFIVGNVGTNPERKMAGDKQIVEFSIARPTGYGKNAGEPTWFRVAVWDDSIKEQVLQEVRKGDPWAVVGPVKEREYQGKTYRNISAYRIGRVNFLFPSSKPREDMWPENSKMQLTEAKTKLEDKKDDDELDW